MSGPKFPAGQSVETVDLPAWAIMWLLFSAVSVLFEAAFIFGRQYGTLPKGKFGWLFGALHIYSKVDPTYLDVSHDEVVAMEALNVLEALVIFAALLVPQMQHVTTMMMLTIVNIGQCWKTLWYQLSMLRRFSRVGVPAKASKWCLYLVFGLLNTMYIIMPFLVAMSCMESLATTSRSFVP
ncbi:MAG: hypothetical protein MHM6MM_005914 [Cercozoa sp. M6MM]